MDKQDFSREIVLSQDPQGQQRSDQADWLGNQHNPPAWRQELARWLATLNPGRTPREYEKAIGYFFQIPGVPQELPALTSDLLLAYRGALALRATPPERQSRRTRRPTRPTRQLSSTQRKALPGEGGYIFAADHDDTHDDTQASSPAPLAPATVNIRLTALRQFLIYCHVRGSLPQLTPDQIRLALRRLTITRRRPYQVLAESEWEAFLAAALIPTQLQAPQSATPTTDSLALQTPQKPPKKTRSPWGTTRAMRRDTRHVSQPPKTEQTEQGAAVTQNEQAGHVIEQPGNPTREENEELAHSRAGLTGQHTAQRDHALVALALATGLRAVELSLLDVGDLSREHFKGKEEWWLILPDAKTKGQRGGRTLPLAPALVETLLAYIRTTGRSWSNPQDRTTALFLSNMTQQRLTASHIRRIVDRIETQWLAQRQQGRNEKVAEDARGETRAISPHALRHSTAVALLEGNAETGRPPASVEHVRGWLGHFDIRTTQGYLAHLDGRRHRRAFALAPEPHTVAPETPQANGDETDGVKNPNGDN